jgi:hypothetical protein
MSQDLLSWRVTDDRRWAEVLDADGERVALFRDDDQADAYVAWINASRRPASKSG